MDREYVVAYTVTRNWYQYMPTVINSLLTNNPFITKIYMFIEDDEIETIHDSRIEFINMNEYVDYIDETSPNYNTQYSKMSWVRCEFAKYLDNDYILYLDSDTLVCKDIKKLWDMDFGDNGYVMMVQESPNLYGVSTLNSGVCFFNLKKIWEDKKDDDMINFLNHRKGQFPDQEAINDTFDWRKGEVIRLGAEWNSCGHTCELPNPYIRHATGSIKFWYLGHPYHHEWEKYYTEEYNGVIIKPLNIYQRILRAIKNRKEDTKCSK